MDFNAALDAFLKFADNGCFKAVNDKMAENFPKGYYNPLATEAGSKFVRVVSSSGGSRSVWCFVEKSTGEVLKADGWKKPSKLSRGINIFKPESYAKCDPYGGFLYLK